MSGFHNADITKGLLIGVAITSLTASLLDIKPYLHLQLVPHITKYHQFFRIAIHPLAFANSTELLVGLLTLSSAGITVERAFGSRKYAAFLLLSSALSTFLALCAMVLGHGLGLRYIPGGPYGVLFSILWQRHRLVPPVYTFRMMGVDFSAKTFSYILVSQLLLSDPPASLLAASTGLFTGYIYDLSALPLPGTPFTRRRLLRPLKAYRLPSSIHTLLGRLFVPILGSAAPPRRAYRIIPGQINESQLRAQAGALSQLINGRMGLGGRAAAAGAGTTTTAQQGMPRTGVQPRPRGAVDTAPTSPLAPEPQPGRSGAAGARAAMGEWVSELAGRGGARAPTEEEISTLSNMFPTIGRDRIVRALQRNDYNTAQAVEALLEENT